MILLPSLQAQLNGNKKRGIIPRKALFEIIFIFVAVLLF